jgi:hypothetical protein
MTDETEVNESVKRLALEYAPLIVKKLIIIALEEKTPPSLVIQASQIILDRGIGRVKNSIDVNTGQQTFVDILRGLNTKDDSQLKKEKADNQLSFLDVVENLKREVSDEKEGLPKSL